MRGGGWLECAVRDAGSTYTTGRYVVVQLQGRHDVKPTRMVTVLQYLTLIEEEEQEGSNNRKKNEGNGAVILEQRGG